MQLYVTPASIDETNMNLGQLLEGTPPSDAYFFACMSSLGVSWGQLRILISALKLWCNCNLDPTWEIMQRGPVRSMFRSSALDYLRQRLQVRRLFIYYAILREILHSNWVILLWFNLPAMPKVKPSDLHRMIKTHSRLTGYDACFKMKPTLNKLQSSFGLTGSEMRKIVLRMQSHLGMGIQSIDDKFQFFLNEG